MATAEGAMDYDADGYVSEALADLDELHHAACKEGGPDPRALARRLFEWELRGHYDTFFEAANTYADVLGEEGLGEYRRLAEERWAHVRPLGPGEDNPRRYGGERFRSTYIMETLARQEGDVEAAWREAQEGGCSEELWLELAARREEEHPEDALAIYEKRIEPLIKQTNNAAYKAAYELLLRVRDLMRRLDRQAEFEEYLELLRAEYKRKRNFMKLLEQIE